MSLVQQLENASNEFRKAQKELEQLQQSNQQYLTQKHENDMVIQELKLLGDDAQVFKLVGPVMVKKDKNESIVNVQTRLDLINRELKRIEKRLKDVEKKARDSQDKVRTLQQMIQLQKQKQQQK